MYSESIKVSIVLTEAKLAPTIRLTSGYDMPIIGLGTFEVNHSSK